MEKRWKRYCLRSCAGGSFAASRWGRQFSVIRWTSPLEGNITVSGHFGAGDSGNMSYFIYKNGASALYTERNSYADGFFSVNQDVSSGDTLDFIVGEGYISGNTPLHAKIVVNSSGLEQVAAPAADPAGGEVAMGTAVHLSTATAGAEIYYTIDGSEPGGSSTRYEDTEPIIINGDVTVKAVVIKNGVSSTVMTVDYTAYGEYNGHYYRIIDREINWGDAGAEAETLSYNGIPGHLLTVDSRRRMTLSSAWAVTIIIGSAGISLRAVLSPTAIGTG